MFIKQSKSRFVKIPNSLCSLLLLVSLIFTTQLLSSCGGGGDDGTTPGGNIDNNTPDNSNPNDPPIENPPAGNVAPIADAGGYKAVNPLDLVNLDGTSSSDANGDTLGYRWSIQSKPGGSGASLSNPFTAEPSFTADVAGKYIIELIVNDGEYDSVPSTVTVMAAAFTVTVSWQANTDNPPGYAIYAGPTTATATTLVRTLVDGKNDWDPEAPSADIDSTSILNAVGKGTQACFVIKAYNGAGTSPASTGTCINNLPQ